MSEIVYMKCCRIWPQYPAYAGHGNCGICGEKPKHKASDREVIRMLESQLFELRRELYEIDRQITLSEVESSGSY